MSNSSTQETSNAVIFKSGDVVRLRSGGPDMIVVDVGRETGLVFCQWHNGERQYQGCGTYDYLKPTELKESFFHPGILHKT